MAEFTWPPTNPHVAHCPHGNGLWLIPDGPKRNKWSNPYSYSEFFHIGDHKSIKNCEGVYSDRLSQWDHKKYVECSRLIEKRFEQMSVGELSQFMS